MKMATCIPTEKVVELRDTFRRAGAAALARAGRVRAQIDKAPLLAAAGVYDAIDMQLTALLKDVGHEEKP